MAAAATAMESQNGTPSTTRRAASSAAIPANAICPSDSWPAQPVSTVSDDAEMAIGHDGREELLAGRSGDDEGQHDADRRQPR